MLRIVILLVTFAAGFATGIWYDRWQMSVECSNGEGDWTGTICVDSELLQ